MTIVSPAAMPVSVLPIPLSIAAVVVPITVSVSLIIARSLGLLGVVATRVEGPLDTNFKSAHVLSLQLSLGILGVSLIPEFNKGVGRLYFDLAVTEAAKLVLQISGAHVFGNIANEKTHFIVYKSNSK
jgi:hypothetical protein